MENPITILFKNKNPKNTTDALNCLREIIQNIILIGLSRTDFFEKASFYGGTALRIFYNLDRYSEDLDFTLNYKDDSFNFDNYIDSIVEAGKTYGLDLIVSTKIKNSSKNIESAFAKVNTYKRLITVQLSNIDLSLLHKDELLKVKFEVDTNPPLGFNVETKIITYPEFANVKTLDLPSLFAGKIAAILCRDYNNNVKGRDYYDFVYFINLNIKPNIEYLRNKLIEQNKIKDNDKFDLNIVKNLLKNKFESVNYDLVQKDINRFIYYTDQIKFYTKDIFIQLLQKL